MTKNIRIESQNGGVLKIMEGGLYMFKISEKKNNPIDEWFMHMNRQWTEMEMHFICSYMKRRTTHT